jgi:tRNA dimethylallyltransferase
MLSSAAAPAPLVMLLGPTASGKSAAALEAATRLPIEIVSVDSALVYRDMDIGTAKPDRAQREQVPHHLLDLIEPTDAYSAARFVADASDAIRRIRARGRLPLLVGGTMLYAKALTQGLHALPTADPALRARIDDEARLYGWPALHARLARLDPDTAARLAPADSQRIQRALEVIELTGVALSRWLSQSPDADAGRTAHPVTVTLSLEPSSRSTLHERIANRLHAMVEGGFLTEVEQLRARGDLHAGMPSMRCVGYRQLWKWFDEGARQGAPRERAIAEAIAATRQLAKRQLTWLRSMPDRLTIDCCADDAVHRAIEGIRRAFGA